MSAAAPARLSQLLAGMGVVPPSQDVLIQGISTDSRQVQPGWLFLAAPGVRGDGRDFIAGAVARGAAAVVYEQKNSPADLPVPAIPIMDLNQRVGVIADRFFGSPSHRLFVVGVTGTNGKTTCTH